MKVDEVGNGQVEPSIMRISSKYAVDDWKRLTFNKDDDWRKAVDIFRDRMETRFLNFVRRIEKYQYAGFVVLAIDCLLIETLQQFFYGRGETPSGRNAKFFVNFLTRTSFSKYFDEDKATRFYHCIRCGILHQSEVKGKSKVLIRKTVPMVQLPIEGEGLIVNRRLFHMELLNVYEAYIADILKGGSENQTLRANFRKKMDHTCQIEPIF